MYKYFVSLYRNFEVNRNQLEVLYFMYSCCFVVDFFFNFNKFVAKEKRNFKNEVYSVKF